MFARPSAASGPWPRTKPDAAHRRAYAEALPAPYWLERPERPEPRPALGGPLEADLVIVGGGLTGLWAALSAIESDPGRRVAVVEAGRIADGASGRNGGFWSASLTHGLSNGLARFPDEMETLERLATENFDGGVAALREHGIEADFEPTGHMSVALAEHEVGWLREEAEEGRRFGHDIELLDRDRVRAEVDSPLYLGGMWDRTGAAMVDPAKLCWGLAAAAERAGAVEVFERTTVESIERAGAGVRLTTRSADGAPGEIRAEKAMLATAAVHGLVPQIRWRVVPVWDYVLMSEPLSREQLDAVGWRNRQGLDDCANQFHYYRLTADDRILWGGYDAIYNFRSGHRSALEQRERSFAGLSQRFFTNFPQLEGLRFSHRWGGAIDTCSRFFSFQGTALGGRVAYSVGHTGLGVGASRFGARVALDMLAGRETEATRLRAMRSKPIPFPPEPLRWGAIELTRNRLAAADRRSGERGLWLRTLDRLGLGFDS
ncbi:FAD-dependent oxidoreductase [Thermoleophilia bacterium SCSIO 60948]|nr:FAD-dependent oxidoreductase [Thermoleophilia bacterium SCSIO 60948]